VKKKPAVTKESEGIKKKGPSGGVARALQSVFLQGRGKKSFSKSRKRDSSKLMMMKRRERRGGLPKWRGRKGGEYWGEKKDYCNEGEAHKKRENAIITGNLRN